MVAKGFSGPLKKLLAVLETIYAKIGVVLLGLILIVNGMEIFSRTILDHSFYWIQEFTVVGCGYVIFLGVVVLFQRKANIVIATIYDRLPQKVRGFISVFSDAMILFFVLLAIRSSFAYVRFIYGGYTQTMSLPMPLVYLPMLICFSTLFLVVLDWLLTDIAALGSGHGDDAEK